VERITIPGGGHFQDVGGNFSKANLYFKNSRHWLSTVTVCYWTYWSEQNKEPTLLTPDTISGLKMWLGHCHESSTGNWRRSPIYTGVSWQGREESGKTKRGRWRGVEGREKGLDHPSNNFWICHRTKQEMWPPSSADTVCRHPRHDTGTAFCFPN